MENVEGAERVEGVEGTEGTEGAEGTEGTEEAEMTKRRRNALFDEDTACPPPLSPTYTAGTLDVKQLRMAHRMYEVIRSKRGIVLAADVGVGKTRVGIRATSIVGGKILVIVPKSVQKQWNDELVLMFGATMRVVSWVLYKGADRTKRLREYFACDRATKVKYVITTMETFRNDVSQLKSVPWSTVLIDEIHGFLNPTSKAAQAIQMLPQVKIGLTATPTLHSDARKDILALLHLIDPSSPFLCMEGDGAAATLEEMTEVHVLAITKADLGIRDVPVEERYEYVSFSEEDCVHYTALLDALKRKRDAYAAAANSRGRNSPEAADALRQYTQTLSKVRVMSTYAMDAVSASVDSIKERYAARIKEAAGAAAKADWRTELDRVLHNCLRHEDVFNPRIQRVFELIREAHARSEPTLVFSSFVLPLEILRHNMMRVGIGAVVLTGEQSKQQREDAVRAFTRGTVDFLLLTKGAGGVGLNLQHAANAIIMDTSWDPQKEVQVIGRMNRRTQLKDVIIITRVVVPGCFDVVRFKVHKNKMRQMQRAMNADDAAFCTLDCTGTTIFESVQKANFVSLYGTWRKLRGEPVTYRNAMMLAAETAHFDGKGSAIEESVVVNIAAPA